MVGRLRAACGMEELPPRGTLVGVMPRELKPTGGRGTFRAICVPLGRETLSAGCPVPAFGGLGTPRREGEGTPLAAFSGPCGIMRDGVSGEDSVLPPNGLEPEAAIGFPPECPIAGDPIRETTGRIPVRPGMAARSPACGPSIALRVGATLT